ncbi:MAG: hypothetical protein IKA00_13750 [Prevotella sp.]|nr:hypothetical protein [Prevotella sp.]
MKDIYRIARILLLVVIVCGCSSDNNNMTDFVRKSFGNRNIEFDKSLKTCLIIPESGCSGCIASGMLFVKNNQDYFSTQQDCNIVVFTNIISRKSLKRKTVRLNLTELNARIDSVGDFFLDCPESKYPIILYLRKGAIIKADYAAPNKDGMKQYQNYLLTTTSKM